MTDNAVIVTKSLKKYGSAFFPKRRLGKHNVSEDEFEIWVNNYQKALGTYAAILTMLYTNFSVDMPLTTKLTNFFREKVFKQEPRKINIYDSPSLQKGIKFAFQKRAAQYKNARGAK